MPVRPSETFFNGNGINTPGFFYFPEGYAVGRAEGVGENGHFFGSQCSQQRVQTGKRKQ